MRFPGFEGEWENTLLKNITVKVNKKNIDNKIDVVFSNSATQGIVLQNEYFDKNIANKENLNGYYVVEANDFVYNPRLSSNAEVGAMSVNHTKLTGLVSPLYMVFRLNSNNIENSFLEYIFKSKVWHNHMRGVANQGARDDRMSIKDEDFFALPLIIPQKEEQKKIADLLQLIDVRISTQREIIDKYESLIKGLSDLLYSQNIRFKDKNRCEFPIWRTKSLEVIGETFNGLSGKTKEDFGTGKPYIQYKQVFDSPKIQIKNCGLVDISKNESQNRAKFGDVFFTISSETPGEIGMSSVLLDEVDEIYLNSFCFGYRPFSFRVLNPLFASYLFRNSFFRKKVVKIAQGSTRYNISKDKLMKIEISLPNVDEQIIIASFLSAIDEKIKLEKEILKLYIKQKNYLLQNLFI